MRKPVWLVTFTILLVIIAVRLSNARNDKGRAVAVPPLSLEGYRDEKLPEAPKKKVEMKVDNGACYVCHANYEQEPLVLAHGKEEVGCINCHGESVDHRNDEDNITAPDTMYPLEDIDEACSRCHDEHDVPARAVIQRWQKNCPGKKDPKTDRLYRLPLPTSPKSPHRPLEQEDRRTDHSQKGSAQQEGERLKRSVARWRDQEWSIG